MAQFSMSIRSKALGGETFVTVILPIATAYEDTIAPGEKFQTLWLLHGGGGNSSEWSRFTDVERLAENHKFAVVMPEVGMSFYNDAPFGPKYFTYVTEELPALLRKHFPLSDKREDNFVVGLSMGGYGAAKCAFNYPERYGAVGLMSTGPMNPLQLLKMQSMQQTGRPERGEGWFNRIFGSKDNIIGTENDVWYILENAIKDGKELPLIYDCCGTEDFTYAGFVAFKAFSEKLGIEVTFEEGPGCHMWDFWSDHLVKFIDWLPLLKNRDYAIKHNIRAGSALAPRDNSDISADILNAINELTDAGK